MPSRLTHWKKKHPEVSALLLERSGGRCEVCTVPFGDGGDAPCLDHDDERMVVRGLLCLRCNAGMGALQVSAGRAGVPLSQVLNEVILYLDREPVVKIERGRRGSLHPRPREFTVKAKIKVFLADGRKETVAGIAAGIGVSEPVVRVRLHEMIRDGLVTRFGAPGSRFWRLV